MKRWTHEVYAGKKTLGDLELEGKRVFLRVDYNVPIKGGVVIDNTKIVKSLMTIDFLLRKKVSAIVIGSHLGRPEIEEDPVDHPEDKSMLPVLEELNCVLKTKGIPAVFQFEYMKRGALEGKWVMVQNLRTLAVEKDPADSFTQAFFDEFIQNNCDIMINDAFAVMHRSDYSVAGVKLEKVAGLLVDAEMQGVSLLLGKTSPSGEHSPLGSVEGHTVEKFMRVGQCAKNFRVHTGKPIDLLIIGGCKLEDKIKLVKNLAKIASNIFLGGLLGVPLFSAQLSPEVEELIGSAIYEGVSLFYPLDYIMEDLSICSGKKAVDKKDKIRDIGPESEDMLEALISKSSSIFWNGTLGMAEIKEFAHGTDSALAALQKRREKLQAEGTSSMISAGGGDTGGYINSHGYAKSFDLLFTGGGATLAALQGDILPGIEALSDKRGD